MALDCIPTVRKFCGCIPLKFGSIFIAFFGLLLFIPTTVFIFLSIVYRKGFSGPISGMYACVKLVSDYVLSFFSFMLILGIKQENEASYTNWVYAALFHIIFMIVFLLFNHVGHVIDGFQRHGMFGTYGGFYQHEYMDGHWWFALFFFVTPYIMFYFMMVIKSFSEGGD